MKKTVLVTGASRGIGRETAKLFAQNGYNVAINYYKGEEAAESLYRELKTKNFSVVKVKGDVRDKTQVEEMVRTIYNTFGSIDVLVNNAGVAQEKLFTDITEEDWDWIFDVNVKGVFNCCQSVLPAMISKKRGKIINISSIWGITGASCEVHYSAAKAAVIGFTKALAKEVGPSNIQVNCVCPGIIETDMIASIDEEIKEELKRETPLGVIGTPRDIAEVVLFLASDKGNFITGQIISPNGGLVI
ncbi:3-oxoacyl-[acyl-carrier protein] reductase [Anaerobranca californiensis DSM 14826]|uniref:3-oxoacyl-[acyl-carrier protein] reductase n=1 Tax=Anaerobranca californiensis DSM 14826 TaxID=1120989 RepID=A0A1M6QFE4_9FIRM|nr:SDR family oxidoreductase [Anaerobranca californiensis]SHK18773.1 3-oxoacyl-[acyl-carrier protein] reductase [Anaerobranca californiensis DSM 14826]